jgi:TolB protein
MGLGNWQLKTIDSYGDHDTTLLAETNRLYSTPVWSPDGAQLAFIRQELDNLDPPGLFTVNADGSGLTRLTPGTIAVQLRPSWSPDGRQLTFSGNPLHEGLPGNGEIYVINADGSGLQNISDAVVNGSGATWSPDGNWIAFFASDETGASMSDISVIRPDGTDMRRLSKVSTMTVYPAWSPDSQHLAFDTVTDELTRISIYTIGIDGTGMTRLTESDGTRIDMQPVWSRDGNWIAFTAVTLDENVEIYVVQPDGNALMNLTNNPAIDSDPAWAGGP